MPEGVEVFIDNRVAVPHLLHGSVEKVVLRFEMGRIHRLLHTISPPFQAALIYKTHYDALHLARDLETPGQCGIGREAPVLRFQRPSLAVAT